MQEHVYCPSCRLESHSSAYTQQLHTITAAALRMQREDVLKHDMSCSDPSLSALLSSVELQNQKTCDRDKGVPPVQL